MWHIIRAGLAKNLNRNIRFVLGQMMLEDRIHPNGDLIGLSHSQTLPHSLSHHIKSKLINLRPLYSYSHGQELFYKSVSNFTNKLVKQL